MRASSRRLYIILFSLLLLVGSFVLYSSFVKEEYGVVNKLRGTEAAKRTLLESQTVILNDIKALLTKYQGAISIQKTVSLALPQRDDTHLLYYQLLNLPKQANLSLDSLGVSAAGTPLRQGASRGRTTSILPHVGTVKVNISVKGSYEDFLRFLQLLETNIRILDVESFTVSPQAARTRVSEGQAPAPETYTYSLAVAAYYQSE